MSNTSITVRPGLIDNEVHFKASGSAAVKMLEDPTYLPCIDVNTSTLDLYHDPPKILFSYNKASQVHSSGNGSAREGRLKLSEYAVTRFAHPDGVEVTAYSSLIASADAQTAVAMLATTNVSSPHFAAEFVVRDDKISVTLTGFRLDVDPVCAENKLDLRASHVINKDFAALYSSLSDLDDFIETNGDEDSDDEDEPDDGPDDNSTVSPNSDYYHNLVATAESDDQDENAPADEDDEETVATPPEQEDDSELEAMLTEALANQAESEDDDDLDSAASGSDPADIDADSDTDSLSAHAPLCRIQKKQSKRRVAPRATPFERSANGLETPSPDSSTVESQLKAASTHAPSANGYLTPESASDRTPSPTKTGGIPLSKQPNKLKRKVDSEVQDDFGDSVSTKKPKTSKGSSSSKPRANASQIADEYREGINQELFEAAARDNFNGYDMLTIMDLRIFCKLNDIKVAYTDRRSKHKLQSLIQMHVDAAAKPQ